MIHRRRVFSLFAAAIGNCIVFKANAVESQPQTAQSHVTWVAKVLERMQTIKPGATRQTLLTVFTTEGGLSTGLKRTLSVKNVHISRSTWTLGLLEGQIGTTMDGLRWLKATRT
jgi:hypothetical protein